MHSRTQVDGTETHAFVRWARFTLGMLGFGVGASLMIRSGLGLGPWDALHVGVHELTGITVGTASILTGVVIVAVTSIMRERSGVGTLANMILIGVFIDLTLPLVPPVEHWAMAFTYYLVAIALAGVSTGLYIATSLGKGPRDGLAVAISRRTNWSIGRVRTTIEVFVLAVGWAMGGPIGIGTILFATLIGPSMQWGMQLFGALPTRVMGYEL